MPPWHGPGRERPPSLGFVKLGVRHQGVDLGPDGDSSDQDRQAGQAGSLSSASTSEARHDDDGAGTTGAARQGPTSAGSALLFWWPCLYVGTRAAL